MPEMAFLVLFSLNNAMSVVPEKYPKEQCEQVGKDWGRPYKCIPAPSFPLVTFVNPNQCDAANRCVPTDTLNQLDKRYPGYYCGGRDSECRLLKVE